MEKSRRSDTIISNHRDANGTIAFGGMGTNPMFLPGLSVRQDRHLAEMLHRLGRVTLPLFVDADVAGQRAIDPLRPSGKNVLSIAKGLAAAHDAPSAAVGFAIGMAMGLRLGKRFQVEARERAGMRRIDSEYYRLDESDRADIRNLIRHLRQGGTFAVLTSGDIPVERNVTTAEENLASARDWIQRMGKLARQGR